jgi:peptidoglycan/LPS O-acetylase OafA/YrhL
LLGLIFLSIVPESSVLMRTVGFTLNYLFCGAFMLLVLGSKGEWTRSPAYRFIAWIGIYSYSIYLWHVSVRKPLLGVAMHLGKEVRWPALMLSQICCGVLLGVLMSKMIEWPFLRLRERFVPSES